MRMRLLNGVRSYELMVPVVLIAALGILLLACAVAIFLV